MIIKFYSLRHIAVWLPWTRNRSIFLEFYYKLGEYLALRRILVPNVNWKAFKQEAKRKYQLWRLADDVWGAYHLVLPEDLGFR